MLFCFCYTLFHGQVLYRNPSHLVGASGAPMAALSSPPAAMLSDDETQGSGQSTPPYKVPPKELTKDHVYFHISRIRYKNYVMVNPYSEKAHRLVHRVMVYKKAESKWVYSAQIPYLFLGRLVGEKELIELDYNDYFGIPRAPAILDSQDSMSSSKSEKSEKEESEEPQQLAPQAAAAEPESCTLCGEDFTPIQEEEMSQEHFDLLPFVVGKCGHKICRSCWRKTSSMVLNNAAPGYGEYNVLCDASCPLCKGPVDLVSKDRENILRQWHEEGNGNDEFPEGMEDWDSGDEDDDQEDEDYDQQNGAAAGGGNDLGPRCGFCRQTGHNRRTCPLLHRRPGRSAADAEENDT